MVMTSLRPILLALQLQELPPGAGRLDGRVTPSACHELCWGEDRGLMIEYGRSRVETGCARNAGPGGAVTLETKRRAGDETDPADPACMRHGGRRYGDGTNI